MKCALCNLTIAPWQPIRVAIAECNIVNNQWVDTPKVVVHESCYRDFQDSKRENRSGEPI